MVRSSLLNLPVSRLDATVNTSSKVLPVSTVPSPVLFIISNYYI